MTRPPSTTPAARPADAPPPAGRVILTDEQCNLLREATAYRFIHYTIGPQYVDGGEFRLDIRASAVYRNLTIWGSHELGTGSMSTMNNLRKTAMDEYNRLVKGIK